MGCLRESRVNIGCHVRADSELYNPMKTITLGCVFAAVFAAMAFGQCSSLLVPQTLNLTAAPNLPVSYGPTALSQTVTVNPGVGNAWSTTGGGSVTYASAAGGLTSGTGTATVFVYIAGVYEQRAPGTGFTDSVGFTINGT